MAPDGRAGALLPRVRRLCLALPGATERQSHGSPGFFVGRMFASWVDDHHGDGVVGLWCAAPPGDQAELVATDPTTFFVPPYVGGRGWIGVRLVVAGRDTPDWRLVAEVLEDAFRTVAPARRIAELDAAGPG
ncbi:MAG: MmcQ/YjbR family DNA-binding protein [Nocardioidaceae bacterium]|nr:MmcQ/YjbR family DNA-binding protein [Nocardioidaceae bacterium]